MGIFTRFRDIISSNINQMLDRAEDPEKLINLMISEMEDTLVELKSSCACALAGKKKIRRRLDDVLSREKYWERQAGLAVEKGRDDLAREALKEKRRYTQATENLEREYTDHGAIADQYQDDIRQLEDKLNAARERKRLLVQRHIRARKKKQAQQEIRRMDSYETVIRFEEMENRIERMEADADLVNPGPTTPLEKAFDCLTDDDIEKELEMLKSARAGVQG